MGIKLFLLLTSVCVDPNRAMVDQHPLVHHPLDACYYLIADELQLR